VQLIAPLYKAEQKKILNYFLKPKKKLNPTLDCLKIVNYSPSGEHRTDLNVQTTKKK
jgi:hypothetical protein